ncbi:MAG: SDR family NAD(P)-dependent oxidoreductase, partial [Salinivirgaceae bacterium]|nr:SDR family NAD(P)-dependent oxidoreductase [Salinivirgaceae bacterium]
MKYALVTGGSRGIGRAVCVKLAQMGYQVIVNYVSNDAEAQNTLKLIEEAGSNGELLKFDVSNQEEAAAKLAEWQKAHEGEYIEVLVNNA